MNNVGEWVKSADRLPPVSAVGTLLVYTHAGEYKWCGFDGNYFYYFYQDCAARMDMCCNMSIHGAPWWCKPEPPQ